MAKVILATEGDRKHADPLFGLVHVEPIDGPVGGQMAKSRQPIVKTLAARMRLAEPVGFPPNIVNAGFAVIQSSFHTFAEAEVAFDQVVGDQREITLGFR